MTEIPQLTRYVLPKVSIRPNKIVSYNEFGWTSSDPNFKFSKVSKSTPTAPQRLFHNFKLSYKSQIAIKEKINWLYTLSRARYKQTLNGKSIFNFKLCFITLTLPSKQLHPTSQITKECFNQFLTELRSQFNVNNYVWKLEFQQNRNVHYHIVTDSYIDYYIVRKVWNRIINKLGYVDRYTEKMNSLTFTEYFQKYYKADKTLFNKAFDNFAKGKRNGWKVPNSVSTDNVTSKTNIGAYIAKYISKKGKTENPCNPLDTEENSFGLRLWYCSQSLSKLDKVTAYEGEIYYDLFDLVCNTDKVLRTAKDYVFMLFYNLRDLPKYISHLLRSIFYEYAKTIGYVYPT